MGNMNIYYTQTVQFFKREFCTINVHFAYFLFKDVDFPQVAVRVHFALMQKERKTYFK